MRQFETVNILDMIGAIGETELEQRLSNFSCPMNPEIEYFIMDNAIEFARKKLSVTYFVINENGKIVAIFTLAHKAIGFVPFDERYSVSDNTKYIQLFGFF